ncbi:MAG: hypothetical protein GY809_33030 [Planctomycetes bacterium]|nr:hypothetical protein [Planctomycetota bacterium]
MTGKHSGHTSVHSNGGGTPLRAGEITVASALMAACPNIIVPFLTLASLDAVDKGFGL